MPQRHNLIYWLSKYLKSCFPRSCNQHAPWWLVPRDCGEASILAMQCYSTTNWLSYLLEPRMFVSLAGKWPIPCMSQASPSTLTLFSASSAPHVKLLSCALLLLRPRLHAWETKSQCRDWRRLTNIPSVVKVALEAACQLILPVPAAKSRSHLALIPKLSVETPS